MTPDDTSLQPPTQNKAGGKLPRWAAIAISVVVLGGIVFFFVFLPPMIGASQNKIVDPGPYTLSERAAVLHETLLVSDLHADSLLWDRDLLQRGQWGHVDIPRLIEGNVALQAFTVVNKVPRGLNIEMNRGDSDLITWVALAQLWPPQSWFSLKARALHQARKLHGFSERSNGDFMLILSKEHLETFLEQWDSKPDLVGGFLGIEGAQVLEGKYENIDELFDAGFRMMSPTHFFDNEVGGSAHGVEKGGLTDLGRRMITRMEELGMTVDLAHASPAVMDEVLAMATKPVVVSHGGVKGTCDNTRNISDDHLRQIAGLGGVMGVGYWETAVCGTDATAVAKAIVHAVGVMGADHVALGSDYDGSITAFFDTSGVGLVTQALLEAGLPEEDIRKVMGENVVRVLRANLPE